MPSCWISLEAELLQFWQLYLPDKTESTHSDGLQIGISTKSQCSEFAKAVPGMTGGSVYLLVISKVVPKICARTNSAMVTVLMVQGCLDEVRIEDVERWMFVIHALWWGKLRTNDVLVAAAKRD